jgi:hypothetical protein
MATYSIELLIDHKDLPAIKASKRRIILARSANKEQAPNVIWQSVAIPEDRRMIKQYRLQIAWSDEYGIYAANTRLVHGARLLLSSSLPYPACAGHLYNFSADARFHGPYPISQRAMRSAQMYVTNHVPVEQYPSLVFGLAQPATINGHSSLIMPLDAEVVAAQRSKNFSPLNTVTIWLEADVAAGTVYSEPCAAAKTIVSLGRIINGQTLKYSSADDKFMPFSLAKPGFVSRMPHVV